MSEKRADKIKRAPELLIQITNELLRLSKLRHTLKNAIDQDAHFRAQIAEKGITVSWILDFDTPMADIEAALSHLTQINPPKAPNREAPESSLLYAAEIAVNLLRELPGGHGYEIDLLTDAIRNEGGLPEGRDQDGDPI